MIGFDDVHRVGESVADDLAFNKTCPVRQCTQGTHTLEMRIRQHLGDRKDAARLQRLENLSQIYAQTAVTTLAGLAGLAAAAGVAISRRRMRQS